MKKALVTMLIAATAINAYAYDEYDAALLVQKYSETVACQLEDISEHQENQYKAITLSNGNADLGGLGAQFVVYWEGDVGCRGGQGTIVPNLTVVEHSGFISAAPVVRTDYTFPKIDVVRITSFSGGNGEIFIKGLARGPEDPHHFPSKVVSYTLRVDRNAFILE
jgi:hypothetical protein